MCICVKPRMVSTSISVSLTRRFRAEITLAGRPARSSRSFDLASVHGGPLIQSTHLHISDQTAGIRNDIIFSSVAFDAPVPMPTPYFRLAVVDRFGVLWATKRRTPVLSALTGVSNEQRTSGNPGNTDSYLLTVTRICRSTQISRRRRARSSKEFSPPFGQPPPSRLDRLRHLHAIYLRRLGRDQADRRDITCSILASAPFGRALG